jgi:N-acetylneuraminate synthase/pseudaminic acid synthase
MEAFCSVFDDSSVAYLQALNTPAYKIAAAEITDVPLLRSVAATGRPVIVSTGLANEEDLQLVMDTLRQAGCQDIVLLKCTTEYPASIEQANLKSIPDIEHRFACLAGLSDHTLEPEVAMAAGCLRG